MRIVKKNYKYYKVTETLMKHKFKGKMVKTKRDKFDAYHNIQFICKTCYWEGSGKDTMKEKNFYICPDCKNLLHTYVDWHTKN